MAKTGNFRTDSEQNLKKILQNEEKMKAYLLSRTGAPSVLRISEVPKPEPGSGQVRVKIEKIGLNYAEILSRKGLYGWAPKKPYILGMEAFGEIDTVGRNVVNREIGEKVIVGTQFGCYAEYVVVNTTKALPAIETYSAAENAAFAVNYLTAWISLMKMARLQAQDTVLINAAGGGVGTAAVQIAKNYGCTVLGTVGSDEKAEVLNRLNIDAAINYRKTDFEVEVRKMTQNRGVDVILEMVGGDVYKKSVRLSAPFGRVVVAGFASLDLKKWNPVSVWKTWRAIPRVNVIKMSQGSYGVMSSHIGYLLKKPEIMSEVWRELTAFVTEHEIRPIVGRQFDFTEMPEAHRFIESRQSYGKVVVKMK